MKWIAGLALFLFGCEVDSLSVALEAHGGKDSYSLVNPDPSTPEQFKAGQALFWDTETGINSKTADALGEYSCATCHDDKAGFGAGAFPSLGQGGVGYLGSRVKGDYDFHDEPEQQSPQSLNMWPQKDFLHDGRADNLESQALFATNGHGISIDSVYFYHQGFGELATAAYPQIPEKLLMTDFMVFRMISDYERMLNATEAPFQKWIRGEQVLPERQVQGGGVFVENCLSCHSGAAFTDSKIHDIGFGDARTPQLYNVTDDGVYFKHGFMGTLEEAIQLHGFDLPEQDLTDLVAFISISLRDTTLNRYRPDSVPSGNCFPNADPVSIKQLGCE